MPLPLWLQDSVALLFSLSSSSLIVIYSAVLKTLPGRFLSRFSCIELDNVSALLSNEGNVEK
ncbi:uncharacterized protein LY89DRAFT_691909 [Mollisia scopiformis]|uniref:Uncharacterized protein n=1 Tax=Mollisia scopiformis TaxID=149040 RepID=A0A132B3X0_MOLSC|nr:uncharacterized protein LY89DRAFT_691909 [Mollisia scopiformis]KUJ07105.1 hypothetical protein LY89DRAFT_691909 [Mollisia scopiformis]